MWSDLYCISTDAGSRSLYQVTTIRGVSLGPQVIRHYGWGTMGLGYCQQLRAAARKLDWPTFVTMVNPVLLDRHAAKSLKRAAIPNHVNPIAGPDLKEVIDQLRQTPVRQTNDGEYDAAYMLAKSNSESLTRRPPHYLPASGWIDSASWWSTNLTSGQKDPIVTKMGVQGSPRHRQRL